MRDSKYSRRVFSAIRRLRTEGAMKSTVIRRSVVLISRETCVSLEAPFWEALKEITERTNKPLKTLLEQIDRRRKTSNLSSAIRVFILTHFKRHKVTRRQRHKSAKLRRGPH